MVSRGMENMVAVYYNQKVPYGFWEYLNYGTNCLLTLFGHFWGSNWWHSTCCNTMDKRLWWMQTEQNMNDATFAFMLGPVFVLWHYLDAASHPGCFIHGLW